VADRSEVKRTVVPLFVVVAATLSLVLSPVPAGAQTDYGISCTLTVTPPQVTAGTSATVAGTGFQPNLATQVILDDGTATEAVLADVITDSLGAFSTTVTIPATAAPGGHVLTAICDGTTGATAQTSVTVLGATDVNATLTLSKSTVFRLETFDATVTNALPGSTVTYFQRSTEVQVGTDTADANGVSTLTMSFPASAALGAHEVVARGTDTDGDPYDLVAPITVTEEAAPTTLQSPGSTATTGTDIAPQVTAGIAILAAGATLVLISRRRRNQTVTP
jgi:hypothetical protein